MRCVRSKINNVLHAVWLDHLESNLAARLLCQALPSSPELAGLLLRSHLRRQTRNDHSGIQSRGRLRHGVEDVRCRDDYQFDRLAVLFCKRYDPRKKPLLIFSEQCLIRQLALASDGPGYEARRQHDDILIIGVRSIEHMLEM